MTFFEDESQIMNTRVLGGDLGANGFGFGGESGVGEEGEGNHGRQRQR